MGLHQIVDPTGMDPTERHNLSIGITYAVRHLKPIFIALSWSYGSNWKTEAGGKMIRQVDVFPKAESATGHKHEPRRKQVEDILKSNNMYMNIGAGTKISGTALGYIYRTDNLVEKLVTPAKNGQGDWKPTRSLIRKFFDDIDRDLKLAGAVSPTGDTSNEFVSAGYTDWKWDAARQDHYYFCLVDRAYKYQSGMWLRLDGSSTSLEEEIELARSQGIPVSSSLEAPMQQLHFS